jgi:hypothetical protein
LELVLYVYRRLRENYEFKLRFDEAGKPAIIGAITVGLSTLFWLIQNNPTTEPSLSFITNDH